MGLFNWKKKPATETFEQGVNRVLNQLKQEKIETAKATPIEVPPVINHEEKRRDNRPLEDEYKIFKTFSIIQLVHMRSLDPFEVDIITVTLCENALGDRNFTVLRNGVIDSRSLDLLTKTQTWLQDILPWLNNETDVTPVQDFDIVDGAMMRVKELKAEYMKNKGG